MKFFKRNKKFIIIYSILLIVGISLIVYTYHNHSFYKAPIAKVLETKDEYQNTETINYGYKDDVYEETIKAKILNGEHKGEIVTLENIYHKGQAYDQRYKVGDELFVSINKDETGIKKAHIEGYKKDKYVVFLIVFFSLIIILVGKLRGFFSIISVVINIVIFNFLVYMQTILEHLTLTLIQPIANQI